MLAYANGGMGRIPFLVYAGRVAERFGVLPETVLEADAINFRTHDLLTQLDEILRLRDTDG